MQIDKDLFYESLYKKLNPRSGVFQPIDNTNETGWKKVLDIKWKGGIHFIIESSYYWLGHYYVMRDKQGLSPWYHFEKPDDLKFVQRLIDDIEDGKYRNKKTLREQVKSFVEEKSLVSYMNNTKWRELVNDIMEKLLGIVCSIKLYLMKPHPNQMFSGICTMMKTLTLKVKLWTCRKLNG